MAKPEFTNQLLKEAIADAEAVRQTAIENAKLSLEETFTPQIKSMLERKLRAEAEGMGEAEMEEATELPHEDAEAEGSTEMPADSSEIGGAENKEPSPEAEETSDIGTGPEAETDASTDWYDDWSEKDFDLDEVIKELEEDVKLMEAEEGEDEEEGDEDAEEEEGEKEGEEDEAGEKEDEDKGEYPESEPAGDEEAKGEIPHKSSEIGEKDAAKFTLDEFISMMKEAGYNLEVHPAAEYVDTPSEPPMEESGHEIGEGEVKRRNKVMSKMHTMRVGQASAAANPDQDSDLSSDDAGTRLSATMKAGRNAMRSQGTMEETDLNLEEILAMLEAEDASIQEEQAPEQMASEVTKLQEEIAEYRTAVEFLRGKLNEVNLLNAKLLYTNKIFRKEGLTNEQKVTIVENFDRATTVREVKMVYAVLAETLKGDSKSKTTKLPRKVVSEGLASKATPSTAPKTETPEIIAENSVTKRLQQLAGIIS